MCAVDPNTARMCGGGKEVQKEGKINRKAFPASQVVFRGSRQQAAVYNRNIFTRLGYFSLTMKMFASVEWRMLRGSTEDVRFGGEKTKSGRSVRFRREILEEFLRRWKLIRKIVKWKVVKNVFNACQTEYNTEREENERKSIKKRK